MKIDKLIILAMVVIILMGCSAPSIPSSSAQYTAPKEDIEAVRQTASDYIDGWYEGNAERMERALHPNMVKRTIQNNLVETLVTDEMVSFTSKGYGKNSLHAGDGKNTITIMEIYKDIAVVKTDSPEFIDYLQIGKVNGKWVIINVLWTMKIGL
jgi:hypothetical protein